MNARLAAQQGVFVAPLNIGEIFMLNLAESFGCSESALNARQECGYPDEPRPEVPVIKIVLPYGIRDDALRELRLMNITAATLFPGLDGLARSLSYYLQHP